MTPSPPLLDVLPTPNYAPLSSADPGEVANDFEALFLSMLLKPLESNLALFGTGPEGRTFAGLLRQQLADQLAQSRPLGIADQIESTLQKRAEADHHPPALGQARGVAAYRKARG